MKKIPGLPTELENLEWKPYTKDRSIASHPSGFNLIIPDNMTEGVPLFCDVCACCVISQEDISSHENRGACEHCVTKYYYSNKEKWEEGWRPSISFCDYKKTIVVGE